MQKNVIFQSIIFLDKQADNDERNFHKRDEKNQLKQSFNFN